MHDPYAELFKKFDEKFPEFKGVGAQYPIFVGNPNREHLKAFLRQHTIPPEEVEKMKRIILPCANCGYYCTKKTVYCTPPNEIDIGYNQALADVLQIPRG